MYANSDFSALFGTHFGHASALTICPRPKRFAGLHSCTPAATRRAQLRPLQATSKNRSRSIASASVAAVRDEPPCAIDVDVDVDAFLGAII